MLKKISLAAAAALLLTTSTAYAYDVQLKPFKDVASDYAIEPIYTLSAMGIINGYEDLTYRPNADLTREAFIKLLVLASQLEADSVDGSTPADVAKTRWSAPYIAAAYEHQWLDGLLDKAGKLNPAQTITRQEVAMLVGKSLLESVDETTRQQWLAGEWKKQRDARKFKDQSAISAAMQPYVYYATYRDIMEGDPTGFKPSEPLIRKQAAAVIYRLIDKRVAEQTVDFTGYYALKSYPAVNQMNKLSNVIMGWSHLDYSSAGTASLSVSTTEYSVPQGFEEVIAAAETAQAPKELMVFYNGSNLKDFLKDQAAQQSFIDSLLATLSDPAYGWNGVSIDFEGLKEADSAADFTQFLQQLDSRLGAKTLSVAVPPTYYFKGYDLETIGEAADTVILMAYDFTHDASKLPSAPLPLVNDTVMKALQAIPKEKLVLGISKQANQWTTKNGVTAPVVKPFIADVEKRLAMPGVAKTWTMPYFLTKAAFTDDRGSHELYYEDAASIAKKAWLAKFYGLKGISLWYMGNYTASDWQMVGELASKD